MKISRLRSHSRDGVNDGEEGRTTMSEGDQHADPGDPGEVAKEQLLTDLDQTIGDREQALADHEQERLDVAQSELDDERLDQAEPSLRDNVEFDQRQGALDRAEARRDVHQAQLDATQTGRDGRQELLDTQQEAAPVPSGASIADADQRRLAAVRALHARERADAARARALEAAVRAGHADQRAVAAARRAA
jgi:hypothetical protein